VALGVSGLIFAAQLALLAVHGQESATSFLQRNEHPLALALSAAYTVAVGFNWFLTEVP
jgi:hypothetical protein